MKRMSRLADPTGRLRPLSANGRADSRGGDVDAGRAGACYMEVLRPRLAEHGIRLVGWDDLDAAQRDEASAVFERDISPVLTPLSLDAAHPFPTSPTSRRRGRSSFRIPLAARRCWCV